MQSVQETNTEERLLKLAAEIDEFEGYARPHAARIAALADELAKKFNLSSHDRYSLRQAALVHDIGEVVMNRDYIRANRVLRDDERIDMQRHTVIGEQEAAKHGLSRAVQLLVRWHHEWWSGAGYPDALERDLIPLAARILRVCDTYAAMTDARPYSGAISEAEAKRYLTEWAGIEFDPFVVKAFLGLEGFRELASFEVSEKTGAPESLNSNAPDAPPPETKEDFSAGNAERNSPYSQFWGDNN
jgi:HD-GYP domain-containing protein (c-di-GMP phosphodiesterase class II)